MNTDKLEIKFRDIGLRNASSQILIWNTRVELRVALTHVVTSSQWNVRGIEKEKKHRKI